jgi:hypothetical protein
MTSYKSEQTYFAAHLHRILRSCPVSHYSRCGCSTDVSLHHTHTIPISLPTYFMVARELTKHCFHRILRCLCIFAVDAQLPNRCLASTYKYQATRVSLHHTSTPGSASLRCGGLFIYGVFSCCLRLYKTLRVSLHHTSTSRVYTARPAMTSSGDAPLTYRAITVSDFVAVMHYC